MRFSRIIRISLAALLLSISLSACGAPGAENPGNAASGNSGDLNWRVEDFSFKDQDNQSFGLADLRGKVWVADFVFTHCTTVCPVLTANMAKLQRELKQADVPVQLVSFTVDPDRDTPDVLKQFGDQYHADYANWHFLTGYSFDEIKQLSETSFKSIVAKPPEGSDQFTHGTSFFLVNKNGVIVKRYGGNVDTPFEQIVKDAKALQ